MRVGAFSLHRGRLASRALMLQRATELKLCGNDLNDASLAAIVETMSWRLVSCDRGFARFPMLQWINPLAR